MHFHKETPVVYLSGFFTNVREAGPDRKRMSLKKVSAYWRKKSGAKYRCFSFPYVGENGFYYTKRMGEVYEDAIKSGDRLLLDSGAHSFHNFVKAETGKISRRKQQKMTDVEKLRDQTVEAYIEWARREEHKWDFCVNFDYTHNAAICYRMQQKLWKAGLDPIPVFHGERGSLDYFKRYADDGAKLIGLGTGGINDRRAWEKKRVYFDIIFNLAAKYGIRLHGFAITQLSLMFQYPWYSVDSATWAKCSAYGKLIFPDLKRNTLSMVHVSDHSISRGSSDTSYNRMPKEHRRELERKIEDYGFDFDLIRTNLIERYCFNAAIYAKHIKELKEIVEGTKTRWKSLLVV